MITTCKQLFVFCFLAFSIITLPTFHNAFAEDLEIILHHRGKGLLIYKNNTYYFYGQGLPENLTPVRLYLDHEQTLYLATEHSGIFMRQAHTESWENISDKMFRRRTVYDTHNEYRSITGFAANPVNTKQLFLATKHTLFTSLDKGASWQKFPQHGLSDANYITALHSNKKGTLYAGTSFQGLFLHNKRRFRPIRRGLPCEPYSKSRSFYEGISVITTGATPGEIYIGFLFGQGIFYSSNYGKTFHSLELPLKKNDSSVVYDIQEKDGLVYAATSEGIFFYLKKKKIWQQSPFTEKMNALFKNSAITALCIKGSSRPFLFMKNDSSSMIGEIPKNKAAANKTALYSNIYALQKNLAQLMDTLKKTGKNALVIDIKDDWGDIYLPTQNQIALEIQSRKNRIPIKKIISTLHKKDIYVIARIVAFKDKRLYVAYKNKYAIWDSRTKKAWKGNAREYWVDPFSQVVRTYNIAIAQDAARIGFDEIQFDYIRFPSDGPLYRCHYRFQKNRDTYKSEILADFLQQAAAELDVPISVDIYGFNGWYSFGNIIGQDIDVFARFADAVCPMVYPSHFGSYFFMKGPRETRPYRIVYQSGIRSLYLSQYQAYIRPYIQAFNLLSPTWGPDYIRHQVQAVQDSNCHGYIFWNASGEYSMVKKALASK